MRKRIFEIIEVAQEGDRLSFVYDISMLGFIIISIIPLAFKESNTVFRITDIVTTAIFMLDYILRLLTADYKLNKKSVMAFIRYPFTIWALIDLVSILPALTFISSGFKLLRMFRIAKTLKVVKTFRVFKAFRYSKSIEVIISVIDSSKDALIAVGMLAVGYILISALIIFNVETDSFDSFFDAIYWATVSLTTVGYGDIYPVTIPGRIITMISSIFGIAIVALPAGIITAGYMDKIQEKTNNNTKS